MPNPVERVEIITGRERRRRYSAAEKVRLVEAAKHCFAGAAWHNGLGRRPGEKARLAAVVAASGRFPVKAVADTLGVARSNLLEQLKGPGRRRGPYQREGDDVLLAEIRAITNARPTYGYRRVAALLNRARRAVEEPLVNRKRVLRLMRRASLTLQPSTARRVIRAHEGKVVAPASNQRWASDGLAIPAGTARRSTSRLPSTPTTARSWPGSPRLVGASAAR